MASTKPQTTSVPQSIKDHRAIDLAKHLEDQWVNGEPFDSAMVFELANRAIFAEDPSSATNTSEF